MRKYKDIEITVADSEGLVLLVLSTAGLRPSPKQRARDIKEFGAGIISDVEPEDVAQAILEDVALMQKQGRFAPASNRCRCGAELPQVSDDATAPEFCSAACKATSL